MTNKVDYTANGSTVVFPYPFAIPAAVALEVRIGDVIQDVGFHISGAGSADGGMVVFDSPPAAGSVISLRYLGAVSVSIQDATAGHLTDKLVAGANIALETITGEGGVQQLRVTGTNVVDALERAANLSDVADKAAARGNLSVYSKAETDALDQGVKDAALLKAGNLAGLADVAAARTNLGVYSKAESDALDQGVKDAALLKNGNLAGLADVVVARANLGVYSKTEDDAAMQAVRDAALLKANNLSDLTDKTAARTALGVYSSTQTDTAIAGATAQLSGVVLHTGQNLGDVPNKAAARTNLEVYSKTETDDAYLAQAQNLADLDNVATARHNLGLDSVAYLNAAQDWTQPQRSRAEQSANAGGSVVLDFAQYQNFDLSLTADITFANPTNAVIGQKGTIGIVPNGFSITAMGSVWKRVGEVGAPDVITGIGRIDYHIRALDRIEYAYNDVEA